MGPTSPVLNSLLPKLNQQIEKNGFSYTSLSSIKNLFKRIVLSPNKRIQELALLEWLYFSILKGEAITLYQAMADDPKTFLFFISLCFRSKNQTNNEQIKLIENQTNATRQAYDILHASILNNGPLLKAFRTKDGTLDAKHLEKWFTILQKEAQDQGYEDIAYSLLGGHFAYSNVDISDNAWPEIAIRNILNKKEAKDLRTAYIMGYLNRHGSWCGSLIGHYQNLKEQVQKNLERIPREYIYVIEMLNALLQNIDNDIKASTRHEIHDDMGAR